VPADTGPRLAVDGLSAGYGTSVVVDDISLEVEAGEVVALLGRNGMGKTTTLMAIAGAVPPRAGTVTLEGTRIDGLPVHAVCRRGLALVPQGRRIFSTLSVEENLMLGARRPDAGRVRAHFPDLDEAAHKRGSALSGGQQQMLAIARALMTDPCVLLMDEPSEGLAPLAIAAVKRLVIDLREVDGLSIVIAEQNLKLALEVADRVCVLEGGRVAYAGTCEAFRADPALHRRLLGV
jgi:branched-chain amino acid transport system ATP-binding protein